MRYQNNKLFIQKEGGGGIYIESQFLALRNMRKLPYTKLYFKNIIFYINLSN